MSLRQILKDDLSVFFTEDEFAEKVVYYEGATSSSVLVMFFDEASSLGDSMLRKIVVPCESLPHISLDGFFTIGGADYAVIDFFPDELNQVFNIITQKEMR